MNLHFIGNIALNISLFFYLTHYLPQLYRNATEGKMKGLSLGFHHLLLASYLFDLIYGFGMKMPWQYKMVTLIGLACMLIQHWQLMRVYS